MTTYANQMVVNIKKDKCEANFLQISNDDWQEAVRKLSSSAFILYLYLASNTDGFKMALSQKAVQQETGLSKASYHRGVKELRDNDYLVQRNNKEYVFSTTNIIITDSTDEYIEKYLTVLEKDDIKKFRLNLNTFLNITNVDNDKVADYIRQMQYKDFLLTPYWLMLSNYVKTKLHNNTCDECGAKTHLQTHHLTYDRHGYEHVNDVMENDLIVLCSKCHKKAHNIS